MKPTLLLIVALIVAGCDGRVNQPVPGTGSKPSGSSVSGQTVPGRSANAADVEDPHSKHSAESEKGMKGIEGQSPENKRRKPGTSAAVPGQTAADGSSSEPNLGVAPQEIIKRLEIACPKVFRFTRSEPLESNSGFTWLGECDPMDGRQVFVLLSEASPDKVAAVEVELIGDSTKVDSRGLLEKVLSSVAKTVVGSKADEATGKLFSKTARETKSIQIDGIDITAIREPEFSTWKFSRTSAK